MTDKYGERGPWHSGDEKPEIDGVYERKFAPGDIRFCKYYRNKWHYSSYEAEEAAKNKNQSATKRLHWRGLAKKP